MSLLEEGFKLQYPLLRRQVEFFESKQQKGQTFSDWATKLKALGDEAALATLDPDPVYVMRYLTGTCDEKLREKFLQQEEPTMERLDKIVH